MHEAEDNQPLFVGLLLLLCIESSENYISLCERAQEFLQVPQVASLLVYYGPQDVLSR